MITINFLFYKPGVRPAWRSSLTIILSKSIVILPRCKSCHFSQLIVFDNFLSFLKRFHKQWNILVFYFTVASGFTETCTPAAAILLQFTLNRAPKLITVQFIPSRIICERKINDFDLKYFLEFSYVKCTLCRLIRDGGGAVRCGAVRCGAGRGGASPTNNFRWTKVTPANYTPLEREFNGE